MFIDTHCHFTDEAFGQDSEEALERALESGVGIMIQADVSSRERGEMMAFTRRHPGKVYAMAGLYPGSVGKDWREEIGLVEKDAAGDGIVAIGEIGLDYHYGAENAKEQMEAFKAQLEMASRLSLPVNIHLRDATDDFFKVLDSCRGLALRGNLHAFSSRAEVFRRLLSYGDFYVGIGGVVTFKNARVAKELESIPVERILLETDAPYLAPVPLRGTRNESANIPIIAGKVAEIKRLDINEIEAVTTSNALALFNNISK